MHVSQLYPNELFLASRLLFYEEDKPFSLKKEDFPDYEVFTKRVLLTENQTSIIKWKPIRALAHIDSEIEISKEGIERFSTLGQIGDYLQKEIANKNFDHSNLASIDFDLNVDSSWREETREKLKDYLKSFVKANRQETNLSFEQHIKVLNKYIATLLDQFFLGEVELDQRELLEIVLLHHPNKHKAAQDFRFLDLLLALWFAELISIHDLTFYQYGGKTYYRAHIEFADFDNQQQVFNTKLVEQYFEVKTQNKHLKRTEPYFDSKGQFFITTKDGMSEVVDFSKALKSRRLFQAFFELWSVDPNEDGRYTSTQIRAKYKELFSLDISHEEIGKIKANALTKIKAKELASKLVHWGYDKATETWLFSIKFLDKGQR